MKAHEKIKPEILKFLGENAVFRETGSYNAFTQGWCPVWIHEEFVKNGIMTYSVGSVRKAVKELLSEGLLVEDQGYRGHRGLYVLHASWEKQLEELRNDLNAKRDAFLNDCFPVLKETICSVLESAYTLDEKNRHASIHWLTTHGVYQKIRWEASLQDFFRATTSPQKDVRRALDQLIKENVVEERVSDNVSYYCSVAVRQKVDSMRVLFEAQRRGERLASPETCGEIERLFARHNVVVYQTNSEITINKTQYENLLRLLQRA